MKRIEDPDQLLQCVNTADIRWLLHQLSKIRTKNISKHLRLFSHFQTAWIYQNISIWLLNCQGVYLWIFHSIALKVTVPPRWTMCFFELKSIYVSWKKTAANRWSHDSEDGDSFLLTFRWRLQCVRASSLNLESLCLTLKMTCWMKAATVSIPCHFDLREIKKKINKIWITESLFSLCTSAVCQTHLMASRCCKQPALQRVLYFWPKALSKHGCRNSTLLTKASHSCRDVTFRSCICSTQTPRAKMSSTCQI